MPDRREDAPLLAAAGGPAGKPTVRTAAFCLRLELPDQLARGSVQRDHVVARSHRIKDATGDDRLCLGTSRSFPRVIRPRDLQLTDIPTVDLSKGGIPASFRAASVTRPFDIAR